MIRGGAGDDIFEVFRNKAQLFLYGDAGDDTFIVRTFLLESQNTNVDTGRGQDLVQYATSAPVNIDGGTGYDTVILVGTEVGDTFVVTEDGIYGAGRYVAYLNVERLMIEAMEGNDRIYVQSTNPAVETYIFGGLGSDRIEVAGHAPAAQADDLLGHTGLVGTGVESTNGTWNEVPVDDIAAEIIDKDAPGVVMTPRTGGVTVKESGGRSTLHRAARQGAEHERRDHPGRARRRPDDRPAAPATSCSRSTA